GGVTDGSNNTGTLTINNNLTLNSTALANGVLRVEASRTGAGTADASLLKLTGGASVFNLNLGNGKLNIDLINGPTSLHPSETYTVTLAQVATEGNIQLNGLGLAKGTSIDSSYYPLSSTSSTLPGFSGVSLFVDSTNGTLLQLTFTPVPEPGSILLICAAALGA